MSLKEKIMKPLMDAQFEKGKEEGIKIGTASTSAKYEAWKARQEAAGVIFAPDPEDTPEDGEEK